MSSTQTVHLTCDQCGAQADTTTTEVLGPISPPGWFLWDDFAQGDFCSGECLRAGYLAKANGKADAAIAKARVLA